MYTDDDITSSSERSKSPKSDAVISRIRQQIISRLRPEARLASFNEMEADLRVSRTVLREAISQLKRDGFIYSVDRKGLFVSARPPHLSRFGIVFPSNPSSPYWPRFYTALQQEAAAIEQRRGDISLVAYQDVASGSRADGYQRLLEDLRNDRLAGVMILPPGQGIWQSEPFASMALPKIYICGAPEVGRVPSVAMDDTQMCRRMVEWLRSRGRKRIAAVALWGNREVSEAWLKKERVLSRNHWFQTLGRDNLSEVRRVVSLLMDYPAKDRPDGLMVLDDNLTEHAVGGLIDCGLRIGSDIDVIAHCNWPWPVASPAPIQRVGFHARHVLSLSIRAIELMRQRKPLATDMARVPALFEDEVEEPWNATAFDTDRTANAT